MVVFTYALSDFGMPKVIGGNFNMLAIDIFKLVIGQQNFPRARWWHHPARAVVAVVRGRLATCRSKQSALLSARSVPYVAQARVAAYDWAMTRLLRRWCASLLLAVLGMAVYGSFMKLWPYNFSLVLDHYHFGLDRRGDMSAGLPNSVKMAFWCATSAARSSSSSALPASRRRAASTRCPAVRAADGGAADGRAGHGAGPGLHLLLRARGQSAARALRQHDDPGAVARPCTTTRRRHLTAITALKQIDNEFEAVSASLQGAASGSTSSGSRCRCACRRCSTSAATSS